MKTTKKIIFLYFVMLLFSNCRNSNSHKLDKDISEVGFKLKYDSEPVVGSQICATLYFDKSNYKIKRGYFDCLNYTPTAIDEKSETINGCNNKLYMEGDTVKICLTPIDTGMFYFAKIKLLFKDESNNYFVADTTFSFNVKDSIR